MNEEFDPKEYLQQGAWRDVKLGLARTEALLEALGRPQDGLRIVHVAGTNGKGSTCAFIAGILQAAGYRTGLFTSPYILRFNERVQVNRQDISDEELYETAVMVRRAAETLSERPTAFELITAVALVHFRRVDCDVAVLEVGLGGRLDSTNVVDPEVCVITPVALDHTHMLGDTIPQIAVEKAGIIKQGVPVVCAPQEPEAFKVIEERAQLMGAPLTMVRPERLQTRTEGLTQVFSYKDIEEVRLRMAGIYQPYNAAAAIEVARALGEMNWNITNVAIKSGLEAATWPGRFEVVEHNPTVIVDGGHNEQGARALSTSLAEYFPQGGVNFAMGVLRDKNYRAMLGEVLSLARRFFCYEQAGNERALSASDLAQAVCEVADELGIVAACVPTDELGAQAEHVSAGELGLTREYAFTGEHAPAGESSVKIEHALTGEHASVGCEESGLQGADLQVAYQEVAKLEVYVCAGPKQAARAARAAAAADGRGGVACCFGSLYAVADIMEALGEEAEAADEALVAP